MGRNIRYQAIRAIILDAQVHSGQIRCLYCQQETDDPVADHVIPYELVHKTRIANLVTACKTCNRAKWDRSITETFGPQVADRVCRHLATRYMYDNRDQSKAASIITRWVKGRVNRINAVKDWTGGKGYPLVSA